MLHAAGLIDDDEPPSEPQSGGGGGRTRCALPVAVRRIAERCADELRADGDGGAPPPTAEQCAALAPLARQLEAQLAANAASPRTVVSETVFHLEL